MDQEASKPCFFIPVCREFPPPKVLAPSAHCSLTCAARSPISWQRTNHWLFSRYSTTSPERLRERQAKCTALWVLCFSPKGHGTLLHARPSEPRTEQQIKLTQSFCSLAKAYVQSPPFCPLQLYSLPSWRTSYVKRVKMGLPANRKHHGVVLDASEQAPLPQRRHNLLSGHKSVKTLGR